MANKARMSQAALKDRHKEKAVAFKRVVEPRVAKAVKAISLVGNCAGAGYAYTAEQSSQVVVAMQEAVQLVIDKFNKKQEAQSTFELMD